jgi:hypothetical protein
VEKRSVFGVVGCVSCLGFSPGYGFVIGVGDAWAKNFDFCVCGNRGDRAYFVGDLLASQADSRDDGGWWGVENTAGVL